MALRQVEVDGAGLQVAMAEQQLDSAYVGAGLQQMSGKAVAAIPGPE